MIGCDNRADSQHYCTVSVARVQFVYALCAVCTMCVRCACVRLHGRVVKGVGHLGHDEGMEAGGREFDPRPGMSV